MHLLFFHNMPTHVRLFENNCSTNSNEVKKLSNVMFRFVFSNDLNSSSAILSPTFLFFFFQYLLVSDKYFHEEDTELQHHRSKKFLHHIYPALKVCIVDTRPLSASNFLSIVKYTPGLYDFSKFHLVGSQISGIEPNLSLAKIMKMKSELSVLSVKLFLILLTNTCN